MKYWIYQGNAVKGPFDRVQITQLQGFDEETLVCPEGRTGTEMGDWQRAIRVSELGQLFPSARVATAFGGAGDPAEISDLKERISDIESALERLEHQAQRREEEAAKLESGAAEQQQAFEDKEARLRIGEMESKVSLLESLEREVKGLRGRLEALERKQEERKADAPPPQKEPPAVAGPVPVVPDLPSVEVSPRTAALPDAVEIKMAAAPPPAPAAGEAAGPKVSAPPPAPAPAGSAKPGMAFPPETFPPAETIPPLPIPMPAIELLGNPPPALDPFTIPPPPAEPLAGANPPQALPAAEDLGGEPAAKSGWSGKQKLAVILLILLFAAGMAFFAFLSGRMGKTDFETAQTSERQPGVSPSSQQMPPGAPAREEIPPADFSQQAVDLVKNYKAPGDGRPLDDVLKDAYPQAYPQSGDLSPWTVEKSGPGKDEYQVNFYVGSRSVYTFSVRPLEQRVEGLNGASTSLLNGNTLGIRRPVSKKKRRRKIAAGKPVVQASPDQKTPAEVSEPPSNGPAGPVQPEKAAVDNPASAPQAPAQPPEPGNAAVKDSGSAANAPQAPVKSEAAPVPNPRKASKRLKPLNETLDQLLDSGPYSTSNPSKDQGSNAQ